MINIARSKWFRTVSWYLTDTRKTRPVCNRYQVKKTAGNACRSKIWARSALYKTLIRLSLNAICGTNSVVFSYSSDLSKNEKNQPKHKKHFFKVKLQLFAQQNDLLTHCSCSLSKANIQILTVNWRLRIIRIIHLFWGIMSFILKYWIN